MQKVLVRKLRLESNQNEINYRTGVTGPSKECANFESIIQSEINDGWKVINVSSSYNVSCHCNVIVFVLEKEDTEKEDKKEI